MEGVSDGDFLVEYLIKIGRNGDVTNDVVTHGNSFAEVYRGFLLIREEVERQIRERRACPFNPKYGAGEAVFHVELKQEDDHAV